MDKQKFKTYTSIIGVVKKKSWRPWYGTETKIIHNVNPAELRSKGARLMFRERFGKKPMAGTCYAFIEAHNADNPDHIN